MLGFKGKYDTRWCSQQQLIPPGISCCCEQILIQDHLDQAALYMQYQGIGFDNNWICMYRAVLCWSSYCQIQFLDTSWVQLGYRFVQLSSGLTGTTF